MRRRDFIALVGGSAAAWPLALRAQRAKLPRIGILWSSPLSSSGHFLDAFRQGLHELGYVEGQNMTMEFRSAEGQIERLPDLAAELVQSNLTTSEVAVRWFGQCLSRPFTSLRQQLGQAIQADGLLTIGA